MVTTISRKLTWRKCISWSGWIHLSRCCHFWVNFEGQKDLGLRLFSSKSSEHLGSKRAPLIPTNVQDRIVFVDASLIALLEQAPSGPLFWCDTFSHPKSLAVGGKGWAISQNEDHRKTRGTGGISKLQPLGRSLKTHPRHHLNVSNLLLQLWVEQFSGRYIHSSLKHDSVRICLKIKTNIVGWKNGSCKNMFWCTIWTCCFKLC